MKIELTQEGAVVCSLQFPNRTDLENLWNRVHGQTNEQGYVESALGSALSALATPSADPQYFEDGEWKENLLISRSNLVEFWEHDPTASGNPDGIGRFAAIGMSARGQLQMTVELRGNELRPVQAVRLYKDTAARMHALIAAARRFPKATWCVRPVATCRFFDNKQTCRYGDKCRFAHTAK